MTRVQVGTGTRRLRHACLAATTGFAALTALAGFAGCGKVAGFGGPLPPLVTIQLTVTGDLASFRPPNPTSAPSLWVALVWGAQWLTEPFCILPAESDAAGATIAAGCRDPFGFVPIRVAANVPVSLGETVSLPLYDLPAADVMVGPLTGRVAYGTLVVYDDDGNGTLELATPHRTRSGGDEQQIEETADSADVVYGASFVSMTQPDQRIAFSEGSFNPAAAFYPRSGCDPPPSGRFSVLSAGGFSAAEGLAATAEGRLPSESTCGEADLTATITATSPLVTIVVQDPATVREVSCVERANDSSTRYREPPADVPDLSGRLTACAHLPSFDAGDQSSLIQLVVSGRAQDRCVGLTHYTLRGCRENVACPVPDWDFTATPPAWWPCPN